MSEDLERVLLDGEGPGRGRAGSFSVVQYAPALSDRTYFERAFSGMGPGAQRAATLNLVTTAMGSGVLALPWAFSQCGLLIGTLLLTFSGVASYQSLKLLANSGYATGKQNYTAVVEGVLGRPTSNFLQLILFVYATGSGVGFFIFLGSMLPDVLLVLQAPAFVANRAHCLLGIALFPVLPMLCVRKISSFRYLSMLSIAFQVVVMLFIVASAPGHLATRTVNWHDMLIGDVTFRSFLSCCSIMVFAYCCHLNMFASSFEMNDPNPRRVDKVLARSVMIEWVVYLAVGALGALSFGSETAPIIMSNYSQTDALPNGARGLVVLALLVCLPVNLFGARCVLYDFVARCRWPGLEGEQYIPPFPVHVLISMALVGACVVTAILEENIVSVIGVLGGGGGTTFMLVIPICTVWKLQQAGKFTVIGDDMIGGAHSPRMLMFWLCALSVFATLGYCSAFASLLDMLRSV